jgi:hypothetical protein
MVFVFLKLLLTAIFWGGTFIAGRLLAMEMGPFSARILAVCGGQPAFAGPGPLAGRPIASAAAL